MTIDETIALEKEKIEGMNEYKELSAVTMEFLHDIEYKEQLVGWLEELKSYRENEGISENVYRAGYKFGYNKAIDDFVDAIDKEDRLEPIVLDMDCIEEIAEKLKSGGINAG